MSAEAKEGNIPKMCQRFGASRQSAYEVMERHRKESHIGLRALSFEPLAKPRTTSGALEETVLELRRKLPHWWPTELNVYLGRFGGAKGKAERQRMAAESSIRDERNHKEWILQRAKRPGGQGRLNEALEHADEASLAWGIDYEGPFTTSNCRRCTLLTLSNSASCSLLMMVVMSGIQTEFMCAGVEALFRENKPPAAIRLDSETLFGRNAPVYTTKLSLCWERLESRLDGIEPFRRHEDRRHSSFHWDRLEGGVTCDLKAQERVFESCHCEFNEALDMRTLRARYRTSERCYASQSQDFEFAEGLQSPRLFEQMTILWAAERIPISPALRRESVGLDEEKADHDLSVACGRIFQGCLQVRTSILVVKDPAERLEKKKNAA
jgi:putative transposase